MYIRQKHVLNEKRLTKKQVQELVRSEGRLHDEYTKLFEETYLSGFVKRDLVYELPNDRFLYVFDEKDVSLPGKGDIYPKAYFEKWVSWVRRARIDIENGRTNSAEHWLYYSKNKYGIIERVDNLISDLAIKIGVDITKLDKSYASLELISSVVNQWEIDQIFVELYDNLVVYVGEVIKERVKGHWELNTTHAGGKYPFISVDLKRVQYMPLNACYSAMNAIDGMDFRKEAANEVRAQASRAKFEREFGKGAS